MKLGQPYYQDLARATINLALPDKIADLNLKIVICHINKLMKPCHPAKPWGTKDFLLA